MDEVREVWKVSINRPNVVDDAEAKNFTYGDFSGGIDYMAILEDWRRDGGMPGLNKQLAEK